MSLDVHNLSPKQLTQLNKSLAKYKENSLLKLHNLQRVNHNLIIENTKLRQTLKYGSKDKEAFSLGSKDFNGQNKSRTMDVTVETGNDYTATLYFKCLLSPSEVSDYFNCDFSELQYKVVLVEWNNEVVENASTLLTKQSQLKLKMLQDGIRYLVAVHLCGNDKKLSGQTEFVYDQKKADRKPPDSFNLTRLESRLKPVVEKSLETEYVLNLQVDDDDYLTCKFTEDEQVDKVVEYFMERNKIKGFLRDSLVQCVADLKSSGNTIKTVDISDIIPV
ncbi:conserved hypothetical protein [Theileria orientalis strain Shintoku]|uniref:Uncharacterized protein n=1 Tax=Theileria orientalis strain Shintoku TaxID=869250 RepID=J4C991_THEOR|nr:conserved hypothetical protein [Theileria orientalis strain Shintoku]BAM42128.1 conserved hypothetical protein [Theileria orientalis strain Shintoku]|eukprot:XP_009692429.1 conserved hypothetical protein [Theileria orientalis strain Shintoku]